MKKILLFFAVLLVLPLFAENMRVISLSPALTETIFMLGQGDKLCGRSAVCRYPEAALKLPVAGDFAGINAEKVFALEPDVILANDFDPVSRKTIETLGLKCRIIKGRSIEDYLASLTLLGEILNCRKESAEALKKAETDLAEIRKMPVLKPQPSALWVIWNEPVMVAGKGSLPDSVMRLAGLRNVAEKTGKEYFQCSDEWLMLNPPDYIIWTVHGVPFQKKGTWKMLDKAQVIENLDQDTVLRPGPRIFQGIRSLRESISKKK